MKKLKLNLQSLNAEVLTRSQLKQILGGDGGSGGGDGKCTSGATCGKWVGGATGHWDAGTCAMGKPLGGLPATCECSNGGTGCTTTTT